MERDLQEVVLGARIGNACDCPHLRVTQLPALHRSTDLRQLLECVCDAHLLASRAEVDAALPIEPVRARLREAVRPAAARSSCDRPPVKRPSSSVPRANSELDVALSIVAVSIAGSVTLFIAGPPE